MGPSPWAQLSAEWGQLPHSPRGAGSRAVLTCQQEPALLWPMGPLEHQALASGQFALTLALCVLLSDSGQQQPSSVGNQSHSASDPGPIRATAPMWRCSRIMHMQRELHPTLLSSLEGIVDQMVWFRENWHEEVGAENPSSWVLWAVLSSDWLPGRLCLYH